MSQKQNNLIGKSPPQKSQGVGGKIYSGAASFGRIMATIGAVIMTIIGIVMIGLGIHILVAKSTKVKTSGQVISAQCDQWVDKENNSSGGTSSHSTLKFKCDLQIKYMVKGKNLPAHVNTNSTVHYKKGDKINVYYDKSNPNNVGVDGPIPSLGWMDTHRCWCCFTIVIMDLGMANTQIQICSSCWRCWHRT